MVQPLPCVHIPQGSHGGEASPPDPEAGSSSDVGTAGGSELCLCAGLPRASCVPCSLPLTFRKVLHLRFFI